MGLEVLVPILMGALLKVAGKVGEGALEAVEEATQKGAAGLFAKIKNWWSSDDRASEDLERFIVEPDVYTPVVESRLASKLSADPQMQRELATLVEGMGPEVNVLQDIAEAEGITGARIRELLRGTVNVEQRIKSGKDVVGVDIDRLG